MNLDSREESMSTSSHIITRHGGRGHRLSALAKSIFKEARRAVPPSLRRLLAHVRRGEQERPPVGKVSFGSLRRLTPFSREFGYDRGVPIDRYYIESFLSRSAGDIRGRVLEIGDNSYTMQFGGDRVTRSDVLHVEEGNPQATIVGDLTSAPHIPSSAFDCAILTQTLHLIYDVKAALNTTHRILKPGGVLLATFPGITQISSDQWKDYWYWSFTTLSARRMFEEQFPAAGITLEAHGSVLAAISFLHGLAVDELRKEELDHKDPGYELLITARVVKSEK